MKQKSLLLTSAVLMMGAVSMAADWQKPVINGQPVVLDGETEQYLFNVNAGAFFVGGNDWNTRASVNPSKGYRVKIAETGEGTYSLTDYVETQSAWKKTFADGDAGIWVDNNNGANADSWTITAASGNFFTIGNQAFPETTLGTAPAVDTRLYLSSAEVVLGQEFFDLWVSVSPEEYEGYAPAMATYDAAVALKAAIDAALAKYPSLDLADELAVYENLASTVEELNAAIASVNEKVAQAEAAAAESSATPENPFDLSSLIVNGNFDNISYEGWSGSGFGAGGTTGPCAERYQMTFDTWQQVNNLPKGVYALKANGYYRAGSTEESRSHFNKGDQRNAFLYAVNLMEEDNANSLNDTLSTPLYNSFYGIEPDNALGVAGETSVVDGDFTYYVPNTMASACEYMDRGYYADNTVFFAALNGKAKIGAKKDVTLTSDWVLLDSFRIIYYGNSAASYQYWMDQYASQMSVEEYENTEYVTASYLEAYVAAVADHKTAANYEDVKTNLAIIASAKADIDANIAAWNDLLSVVEQARALVNSGDISGDDVDELGDYIEFDVQDILDEKTLTTEEIREEIAKIEAMREAALANGLKPGADFTSYLVNPSFSTGDWTGWTHEAASGGNVAVNATAKCAEAWNNSNFDIYQTVAGAPVGVYSIAMQGFYREGRGDAAWNLYFDEYGDPKENRPVSTAFVYMNDAKTPLANVFDYQAPNGELYTTTGDLAPYVDPNGEYWYPNDMLAAGEAFGQGEYQVKAYGLVAKKGDVMRVGVKGRSNNLGDSWAIFDNFQLTFEGFNADIIRPLLEAQLAIAGSDDLMGSDVVAEVEAAKLAGEAALADGDGRVMFDALAALYALDEKMEASKALFVKLTDKWNDLGDAISSSTASAATNEEAAALYGEVENAMAQKTYTDAQASEMIVKMSAMIAKLKIPAGTENATDDAPVDLTALIESPSFQNEDMMNSIDGWQNTTGYNFGNDDTQKAALCLEFYEKKFDMYQDIIGLPAGTYAVKMQGFYRYTNAEADYARLQAGEKSLATLYAQAGENEAVEAAIALISSDPSAEMLGYGSENTLTLEDGTEVYIPNDMVSADAYFQAGHYNNGVIVKVGEEGILRIGVKETETVSGGWMIMDNWTLTYYGANSNKEEGSLAISEVAAESHVVKTEIFNLNGMKVAGLQQGINIVRSTLSNGQVIIRKISVK